MWWLNWHLRRFFRSVMNPMNPDTAVRWHRRFRLAYIFTGMTAFSVAFKHHLLKDEKQKENNIQPIQDVTPAHRKARLMQLGDVHIISTGFGVPTKTYDINTEEYGKQIKQEIEAQNVIKN